MKLAFAVTTVFLLAAFARSQADAPDANTAANTASILNGVTKCKTEGIADLAVACHTAQGNSNSCTPECIKFIEALKSSTDANCQAVYKQISPALSFFYLCEAPQQDASSAPSTSADQITSILSKFPGECSDIVNHDINTASKCVMNFVGDHGDVAAYCPNSCLTMIKSFSTNSGCQTAFYKFVSNNGVGISDVDKRLNECADSAGLSATIALAPIANSGLVAKLPAKCGDAIKKNVQDMTDCSNTLDNSLHIVTCPDACTRAFKAITADPTCGDAYVKYVTTDHLDDYNDNMGYSGALDHAIKVCAKDLGLATPSGNPPSPGSSSPSTTSPAPASDAIKAFTAMTAGLVALFAL